MIEEARVSPIAGPSACGCGASAPAVGGPVFALGVLGYDLVAEARRDSIRDHMKAGADPGDPERFLEYLEAHPWESASVHWTVLLDQTPVYAVRPTGPFAADAYRQLRASLTDQVAGRVERVSVPGRLSGRVTLTDGRVVPVIEPELRGMYSWTTSALVEAAVGPAPVAPDPKYDDRLAAVRGFLERVYFELRNLGVTPEERAINYAATNAFQVENVYQSALKDQMELDAIEVERSPVCRPESDCWDVKLLFFYPQRQVQTVRRAYRFTVDVSDVVPVGVGPVRSWFVR